MAKIIFSEGEGGTVMTVDSNRKLNVDIREKVPLVQQELFNSQIQMA